MAFGKGNHLHLIDGSAFIFRAYHALPPLTRKSDGMPVGAVAGFCNLLWGELTTTRSQEAPTHLAVIFDAGSKTFRNEIYPQYKANRPELPEDLRPQFAFTREATRAFNVPCIEVDGYEADDIIATLARRAREAGGTVTIISSDKDLMQLVGDGVDMLDPMKAKRIGPDEVFEKFGVAPNRVVDVQSLAGDSVDNVPGAPGIGLKTAALLIQEYGDLETLLARAGEIKQPKRREALLDNAELIRISKRLVALDDDMPLELGLETLAMRAPEADVVMGFLNQMEFRTLTKRVADKLKVEAPVLEADRGMHVTGAHDPVAVEQVAFDTAAYEKIDTLAALERWIARIREVGHVAVDTETTSLDEMRAELVGISLCVDAGRAAYIPLGHKQGGGDLFGSSELVAGQLPLAAVLAALKPVLQDAAVLKIGQNMKYDWKIFARHGVEIAPFDDTMLMSSAMQAGLNGHGMDALSEKYLGHVPIPIKSLLGSGKSQITFDRVAIDDAVKYAAEDADVTLRLWALFKPQLHKAQVTTVYETLERPLVPVLARMEMAGVQVDRDTLSRMSNAFAQKMAGLEAEIQAVAGQPFNVGSPKQLGEILFDKLGLPGGEKGKTGAYATGADVLEDLATEHALPALVLDWRQLSKLKSTYTDALQDHINPETGRVHTSYSITGAVTGRLASTDPNLQNIPIRSEEGRRIREAFVAPKGKVLVSLDYSQIELRILAHVAAIPALQQAFRDGIDIHALTASEMFNVPLDQMTSDIRRKAKAINFGVIYGISGFGLARNLRIPRAEAQGFIDRYFERFPGIKEYMSDTVAFAQKNGFVQTLFGRKIHTPEINAKGPGAGFAKRAAINAPIQGTAADVIRRAMIRMPAAIADLPAKMLLQVHDELLFEVDESAAQALIKVAKDVMEGASHPAVHLKVPLTVEAGVGATWAAAH
ncbi:MAG: DNA polymerase I [Rhodobacteraceae bacterium]|uniref:DNA polymerase I n=1 Tax=Cypionkella sp. TaxID=2811411 RepID=UPI001322AE38|nr:DNA polymerase I [Cypionkella sp.]KAF0175330.1 MAG: DNA polymerase I [Paracoccaceae bacterium]MDO8325821.1 DNA polymerase I [Cypionkella sp.]